MTELGQNPLVESVVPYDRVSSLAWSPDGSRLALEVTGNFPSPYSGLVLLELSSGTLRILANGGQSPGWDSQGDQVAFQFALGDFSAAATLDSYALHIRSGDIFNLTRSNPEYDPFFQSGDGYRPSAYQTGLVRWSPTGDYLYPTLTFPTEYPLGERGPEQGFIVRSDPRTVRVEHLGTAENWYIYPIWLTDGSYAYLAARPSASTAWEQQVTAAFIGENQAWEGEIFIRAAAWAPDGSRLAVVLAGEERTLFDQLHVIFPRLLQ